MRRPTTRTALRTAAAALALSLMLGACSGEDPSTDTTATATDDAAPQAQPTATAEDIAALEAVTVEGEAAETAVTLPESPFAVSAAVARVVDEGDGETITEGDFIELHSVWVDGKDGSTLSSTWTEDKPEQMIVSASSLASVLSDILIGGKVGVRFAYAFPSGEDTASVAVGQVVSKKPGRAVGTEVAPAEGLPTVTRLENGAPQIEPVNGEAPTSLVVQPVIEGEGPEVAAGQTAMVHYTGWLWDGKQFDSSWERSMPFPVENIGQASVIAGWNEGLVGQKVGSQVMLVVPPDKGYGDEEKENIPPGSTLVFVIDILGVS